MAEVAREQCRVMLVSQGGIQLVRKETTEQAREETKAAEPVSEETKAAKQVRVETKAAESASGEVLSNKPECLRCIFGCDFDGDLDNHMEREHQVPRPLKIAMPQMVCHVKTVKHKKK